MTGCRIVLADDHAILVEGIKCIIEKNPNWKVTGEARDGATLLAVLKKTDCDLVILDIAMPEMDGLAALKEIKNEFPLIKVLVLSMLNDYTHFEKAKSLGAAGYLSKEDVGDELPRAIQKIMSGKMYISPSVNSLLADRQVQLMENDAYHSLEVLTKRERQVLSLIAGGMTNKCIAHELDISVHTVENHRANLSNKLGLKNVAALVHYAMQKRLI